MPDYSSMKSSELKALMSERGISFGDCLEKGEFVKQLVAYDQEEKHSPKAKDSPSKSKKSKTKDDKESQSSKNGKSEKASRKKKDSSGTSGTPRVRKNTPSYKIFASEMAATFSESDPSKLDKLLAAKWVTLSRADKLHWSDRGKAAAATHALPTASAFLKQALTKPDPQAKLPYTAVKKVIQLNEETGYMNTETVNLVAKAAELFLGWMAEAAAKALSGKSIAVRDYHGFLKTSEKLRFLRATVETTPQGNPVDDPSVAIFKGPPKSHITPQPKKKKPEVSEDEDAPLALKRPKLNLQPVVTTDS
jgi:hypothetical protein